MIFIGAGSDNDVIDLRVSRRDNRARKKRENQHSQRERIAAAFHKRLRDRWEVEGSTFEQANRIAERGGVQAPRSLEVKKIHP